MSEAASGKTCVACGADCAGKPRVKDPAGHYFCKSCYDQAVAKKQSAPAAPADDPFALNMDLIAGNVPPIVSATACPECGNAMPAGAVICLNCGYNAQSGKHLATKKVKALSPRQPGGGAWPTVIGVISIVFGGGGTLLNGLGLINAMLESFRVGTIKFGLITISSSMLMTMLSLWLLVAGVGILRRNESSVATIRRWAIAKLVLTGLAMVLLGVLAAGVMSATANSSEGLVQLIGLGIGVIIVVMLVSMVWLCIWPIFVLIWFAREKVKEDVKAWS